MKNNIKEVIRKKGLKNTWIAEQVGCKPCDISNYISGVRKPTHDRLVMLARVCGCSVSDLYPDVKRKTTFII